MSVGEERSAKLNNNKLFEHDRRADRRTFVAQGTCSQGYIFSHTMYCLLLFGSAVWLSLQVQDLATNKEGHPSTGKGGLPRSFVHV